MNMDLPSTKVHLGMLFAFDRAGAHHTCLPIVFVAGMSDAAMDNPVSSINVRVSLTILDSNQWIY